MLAQRQPDRVGVIVHWVMCQTCRFSNAAKWYENTNTHQKVLQNDDAKILWDFSLQDDCKLEHNKPHILIVDKQPAEYHIIHS